MGFATAVSERANGGMDKWAPGEVVAYLTEALGEGVIRPQMQQALLHARISVRRCRLASG